MEIVTSGLWLSYAIGIAIILSFISYDMIKTSNLHKKLRYCFQKQVYIITAFQESLLIFYNNNDIKQNNTMNEIQMYLNILKCMQNELQIKKGVFLNCLGLKL